MWATLVAVCRLFIVVVSPVAEHRLSVCGLQELQLVGLVVGAPTLQSTGSVVDKRA